MAIKVEKAKCAETVYSSESGWGRRYQCERSAGFGPEDKYCRQHAEKYTTGETSTWYRANCFSDYSFAIHPVEVLKESEATLLVRSTNKAERVKKQTELHVYFPTFKDAIEFYERRAEGLKARADRLSELIETQRSTYQHGASPVQPSPER